MIALQSPAERRLMQALLAEFRSAAEQKLLLNIGANTSTVVEKVLQKEGVNFVCDRMDVTDPTIKESFPWHGKSFVASVENMQGISSDTYQGAFANFVLEHVEHVDRAAKEIHRILRPQGIFVCSIPNPEAPEFILSRHTSNDFHQYVRGYAEAAEAEAHHTHYHYKSIKDFINLFEQSGFTVEAVWYDPATYVYIHRFPVLKYISKTYDWIISRLGWKRLLGAVCIVFRKK